MKIYTKTGDKGDTSLFGGRRVKKDNQRIVAYGTCDELNSYIGITLNFVRSNEIKDLLVQVQHSLFHLGAELATPEEMIDKIKIEVQIKSDDILNLEKMIDKFSDLLEPLRNFILPGGSVSSSYLHYARTICRRTEREVVKLLENEEINQYILIYLNRLSDLLFIFARFENKIQNIDDVLWNKNSRG